MHKRVPVLLWGERMTSLLAPGPREVTASFLAPVLGSLCDPRMSLGNETVTSCKALRALEVISVEGASRQGTVIARNLRNDILNE